MRYLSGSEMLFYGGLAVMAAVAVMAVLCMALFMFTGRKLRKKLEQEYGKPRK